MPRPTRFTLNAERLELRDVPALTLLFDYSFDTNGFFNDASRRTALESAGNELVSRIGDSLEGISPTNGNTWTASFFNPATGGQAEIPNLVVPDSTLIIYAGGRNLNASEAGVGGSGGFQAGGDSAWLDRIARRGQATGFSLWGGSLAFDTDSNWNFSANTPVDGQVDFYTVATHELGHVLGFGTAPEFSSFTVNGRFAGSASIAANGGTPPRLSPDQAHWAQGTLSNGQPSSMQAMLVSNTRYGYSSLDYAALTDIGWSVNSTAAITPAVPIVPPVVAVVPEVPVVPVVPPSVPLVPFSPPTLPVSPPFVPPIVPPNVPPSVPVVPPVITSSPFGGIPVTLTNDLVSLSGVNGGSAQLFKLDNLGGSTPVGGSIRPFSDFAGTVRSVIGDVNGDGTPDAVYVTGPTGGSRIRAVDGRTGADIVGVFSAFEPSYRGGLFVALADLQGNGSKEIIVSPDQGGGGRVTVFDLSGGQARTMANFFGIDDPNFRGGARVAAADINGDGRDDIVVAAGFGGGPRVAIFNGSTVSNGNPTRLVSDFFAFDGADVSNLRNGVYVAAGDITGDGRADLVFGAGPGGGPRVFALSGASLMAGVAVAKAEPLANFFAYEASERGGVRPSISDVDGDGKPDLIVGSGERVPAAVKVYRAATGSWSGGNPGNGTIYEPFGFSPISDGVYVG